MRKSSLLRAVGCFCILLATVQLAVDVFNYRDFFRYHDVFAFDARLRHNEIECSHTGVNPFCVWNQVCMHAQFRGHERPDLKPEVAPEKRPVHSYPAWHTAYLWFVGWMSEPLFLGFFYMCFGLALAAFWRFFSARAPVDSASRWFYFGLAAFPLLGRTAACFATGNYGVFMALLMFGLISAVHAKKAFWSGILWAVMMIKPQVAVLLFWPLLVKRNYVAIGLAAAICLAATFLVSLVYGCSPLCLVAQIPAIGAPYVSAPAGIRLVFGPLVGPNATWVWSILMFALCGILTWRLRSCGTWLLFMPALLLFPIWTYSQYHDGVAAWPLYASIPLLLLSAGAAGECRFKRLAVVYGAIVVFVFFIDATFSVLAKLFPGASPLCWTIFGVTRTVFWMSGLVAFDRLATHVPSFDFCKRTEGASLS